MNYETEKSRILNSYTASSKLKKIIELFDDRDALDALRDAETLVELMKLRVTNN